LHIATVVRKHKKMTVHMRLLFFLIFILFTLKINCQNNQVKVQLTKGDTLSDLGHLFLEIVQSDSVIKYTNTKINGYFEFNDIPNGNYILRVVNLGFADFVINNLNIKNDTILNVTYVTPCFKHKAGDSIKCVGGHTDHIIPIEYGKPTSQSLKKAKKGLIRLGGCFVSHCSPRYYCTIHKKNL
jgi:hypothetical protein